MYQKVNFSVPEKEVWRKTEPNTNRCVNLIVEEHKGLKTYSIQTKPCCLHLFDYRQLLSCITVSLTFPLRIAMQYASEIWHAFIMVRLGLCSFLLFEVSPEQLILFPPLMKPQRCPNSEHKILWMPYYWLL